MCTKFCIPLFFWVLQTFGTLSWDSHAWRWAIDCKLMPLDVTFFPQCYILYGFLIMKINSISNLFVIWKSCVSTWTCNMGGIYKVSSTWKSFELFCSMYFDFLVRYHQCLLPLWNQFFFVLLLKIYILESTALLYFHFRTSPRNAVF